MTGTRQRTYTRQVLDESRAAWDAGEFSAEWREVRHLAAMKAGIIFPPDGTKWDSWGDDSPSQRAMLIRAIREQPEALRDAILKARRPSWSAVIEALLGVRDELAEDVERDERDALGRDDGTDRQAVVALRGILTVLAERRTAA